MGPPCNCKKKCQNKISQDVRLSIHDKFWGENCEWVQRDSFIASTVKEKQIIRHRPRNNNQKGRRKCNYIYSMPLDHATYVEVCKTMYLNTIAVTEKKVRVVMAKKLHEGGSIITRDRRKGHPPTRTVSTDVKERVMAHINSFPSFESHYSRQRSNRKYLNPELNLNIMYKMYVELLRKEGVAEKDIAKLSYYRHVFKSEFNLSFKMPYHDTCDTCDKNKRDIQDARPEEKSAIENEYKKHLDDAKKRYDLKETDKIRSKLPESQEIVAMVDLQKCLPTPNLTNCQSFYLRKLWTFNLTIVDATNQQSHCMVWDECTAGRGGNEIASCIFKWAQELTSSIKELTIWSDNCSSQNRNIMLILSYMWLLKIHSSLETVNHKYLLRGHTHLEADSVHAVIERKKKSLPTMSVIVSHDWAQLMRTCGIKKPYDVTEMDIQDFKDFHSLAKTPKSPLIFRKRNFQGEPVLLSKVVQLTVEKKNLGVFKYKVNFEDNFKECDLRRNRRKELILPDILPAVREDMKPISSQKYRDLMTLLQWIPRSYHNYFKSLPHSRDVPDYPGNDEDDNN